jgi:hypothetical protein
LGEKFSEKIPRLKVPWKKIPDILLPHNLSKIHTKGKLTLRILLFSYFFFFPHSFVFEVPRDKDVKYFCYSLKM